MSIGVPSLTGGGYYAIALAAKAHGIDPKRLKTVVFKSGGDSITALLGGHVDVMFYTTAAPVAQLRAGKVRILAVAAPKRLAGELAEVPTLREQGTTSYSRIGAVSSARVVSEPPRSRTGRCAGEARNDRRVQARSRAAAVGPQLSAQRRDCGSF